ncbi:MAG TPA: YcxB family protein [Xanthobacteraceae bacterium]|nr:YcxB family protein [Xanthobacteraceae bacterium]
MDYTITYRFGPHDYIALIRASRSIGPLGRLGRWGRAALFGLLIVGLVIAFSYDSLWGAPRLLLTVAAIVFVMVTLVARVGEYLGERLMARWVFPRYSIANKDVTLELGEQGIRSKTGGNEGRMSWSSFVRIIETHDGLFLALSRAELLGVPRRALPSTDAFADFARYVRGKVGASAARDHDKRAAP